MSQGYTYSPPTLEEAIKAYQRAKEKAKQVESYSRLKNSYLLSNHNHGHPRKSKPVKSVFDAERFQEIRPRRRGYSQGSITDVIDSDNSSDDYEQHIHRRKPIQQRALQKPRGIRVRRRDVKSLKPAEVQVQPYQNLVPAWSGQLPYNNILQFPPHYMGPPPLPAPYPGMYPYYQQPMPPYYYPPQPPPPPPQHPLGNVQYNVQPAVPMNRQDFQRDCKYSPAPSRPYSDSDLLDSMSTVRAQEKFSVIPPIQQKEEPRGKSKSNMNTENIRDRFAKNMADKLIDELLVEELLPDLLVEVLLYGVKDVKIPNLQEGVVQEYAEDILDECVYTMLRESANAVMSELISVYSNKKQENKQNDTLVYLIDELIATEIRSVVTDFMKEYILDFQCERIYNQLIYETISVAVYEEVREEEGVVEEEPGARRERGMFDLDNVILASVLCRSLLPNEDYVLDGVIAQGIANHLKLDSDKGKLS